MITQKEIEEYLLNNPLDVKVHIGSLSQLNGEDYIFLDYLTDTLIGSDDKGVYRTQIQFSVATQDFERNRVLVDYIKKKFNVSVSYGKSNDFEYYLTRCETSILMYG